MFPDGGVARLRVYGEPVPDPRLLPATIDLAALENGAVVTGCSNMFYSSPANLLLPGQARVMGDGWETSRRRDQANDWVAVQLACAGAVEVAELDTSHFVGNAPGRATLRSDGTDLLARTEILRQAGMLDSPMLRTGELSAAARARESLNRYADPVSVLGASAFSPTSRRAVARLFKPLARSG